MYIYTYKTNSLYIDVNIHTIEYTVCQDLY